MSRGLALVVAALLCVAACAPDPRTQVIVVVAAEPGVVANARKLRVVVRSSGQDQLIVVERTVDLAGTTLSEYTLGTASDPVAYPIDVAIVPRGGDASRHYWLEVTALAADDSEVSQARVISGFLAGMTLTMPLVLEDRCLGEFSCANAETCRAANCVPALVDPATLASHGDESDAGSVEPLSDRWQVAPTLKATQNATDTRFGSAVAIDGNLIAIGMPGDSSDATGVRPRSETDGVAPFAYRSGAVAIFHRDPATRRWTQEAYIKPECAQGEQYFGWSVALSGNVLVVGAPDDGSPVGAASCDAADTLGDAGSAYVYRRSSSGTWSREAYLRSPSPHAGDEFGSAVAVHLDRVVVGAPGCDSSSAVSDATPDPWSGDLSNTQVSGSAFVFHRDGGSWSLEQHLKSGQPRTDASFGDAVAIEGLRVVVGAPGDVGPAGPGRVYVYERTSDTWNDVARLFGSRTASGQAFGGFVDLDGDTLAVTQGYDSFGGSDVDPAVGAPADPNSGAAYVFVVDGNGAWSEQAYIKAHSSTTKDGWVGISIALDDDRLALGFRDEDGTTTGLGSTSNAISESGTDPDSMIDTGAVFLYRRIGTTWSYENYAKALVVDGTGAEYGTGVAMSYPFLVVGAPFEDTAGTTVFDGPPSPHPAFTTAGTGYLFELIPIP